jgi:glyoxalase family protein
MSVNALPHPLRGLHHVTAVTGNAPANVDFYTRVLGMRLVKKTVNQDDVSAYHLFYGDELGRPGTGMTFFDWAQASQAASGAGVVSQTGLRVRGGPETLGWWTRRFEANGVPCGGIEAASDSGVATLAFQDPEGQRLQLVSDERATANDPDPWPGSPVPPDAAILGLDGVTLTVRDLEPTVDFLKSALGFRTDPLDPTHFEVGGGGPAHRVRVLADAANSGSGGIGGVHHVAWCAADQDELTAWRKWLVDEGWGVSGIIERFYFKSLYFRIPGGILFEIATAGPGFTADGEDSRHLGEKLSLPPRLESHRAQIEAGLQPLPTALHGSSVGA